jgi:hypothetical protein
MDELAVDRQALKKYLGEKRSFIRKGPHFQNLKK